MSDTSLREKTGLSTHEHREASSSSPGAASAGTLSLAIYSLITVAVVLAVTDERDPGEIALVVAGQALALWVAHAYADSVAQRVGIAAALRHALPVLVAAVPSLTVAALGWLAAWEGEPVVYAGESLNLAGLLSLQALAAGRTGLTRVRLLAAVLLDVVAIVTVVAIVALLK